ncbi:hypothetical protein [Methylobacterium sp. 88A]|uniref:hypothetical protein n=1 Tax=Methylobacterium sp. 88A TaxID=1131813 RepID=UPI00036690EE|nr:hypothetical protein [Methylobacterium sp. 88A]
MNLADATSIANQFCTQNGIAADQDRLAVLGAALSGAVEHDAATGRHFVLDTDGSRIARFRDGELVEIDPVEWLSELTKSDPRRPARKAPATPAEPADPNAWVPVKIGSGTGYRRADDPMLGILKAIGESHDAALLAEIPTWPNPWSKTHLNRTRQTIITNKNPALAAQLKAKAA